MSVGDGLHYLLIGNPVSSQLISAASSIAKKAGLISTKQSQVPSKVSLHPSKIMSNALPLWRLAGRNLYFVRLAGLSGAAAVILGAYGSHKQYPDDKGELRMIFETANRYHFFHSIALLGVPICRQPLITGTLMIIGMTLFSGTCYYRALTGDRKYSKFAPIGGFCLILAWLTMLL